MTVDRTAETRVFTDAQGVEHVQQIGPPHVVEGSEITIDLPAGVRVTRRLINPDTPS